MNHDNHWDALEADGEETFDRIVPQILASGQPWKIAESGLRTIRYPEGPLQFQIVGASESGDSFKAAYPYAVEGCVNAIRIDEVLPSPDGCEGIISGTTAGGAAIHFFDTDFCINRQRYEIGRRFNFSFSAIAHWMDPTTMPSLVLNDGPLMEYERSRTPAKPPGDEIAAKESVEISMDGFRGLFANQYVLDNATLHSVVENVKTFKVLGIKFWQIEAVMMVPEDIPFRALVYASEVSLSCYRPRKGDAFAGGIWLQGRLAQ